MTLPLSSCQGLCLLRHCFPTCHLSAPVPVLSFHRLCLAAQALPQEKQLLPCPFVLPALCLGLCLFRCCFSLHVQSPLLVLSCVHTSTYASKLSLPLCLGLMELVLALPSTTGIAYLILGYRTLLQAQHYPACHNTSGMPQNYPDSCRCSEVPWPCATWGMHTVIVTPCNLCPSGCTHHRPGPGKRLVPQLHTGMCLSLTPLTGSGWKWKGSTLPHPRLVPSFPWPACPVCVTGLNLPRHTHFLSPGSHATTASSLIPLHSGPPHQL